MRLGASVLILLTAVARSVAQEEQPRKVEGTVVGVDGKGQGAVRIATTWSFDHPIPRAGQDGGIPLDEEGKPKSGQYVQIGSRLVGNVATDAQGRFRAAFRDWQRESFALTCFTEDGRFGAVVDWPKAGVPAQPELRLQPTVRVHGLLKCSQLGLEAVDAIGYLQSPRRTRLGTFHAERKVELRLPPGEYGFYLYGIDLASKTWPVTVPAEREDLDLGTLDLPAKYFALQRGKVLPEWKVTAARGVPLEKSRLADFRGKWLLVEFWGFW